MLRSTRRVESRENVDEAGEGGVEDGEWLTLREASEVTGVPTSTIRKWARHERIPSFLDKTPRGQLRMVSIRGIERWANEIGRHIEAPRPKTSPRQETVTAEIDLTAVEEQESPPDVPEGSMLVPLDAWNRMLNQLGNLHEAGQQLAEARERAAKAETEALFLRERLRELREEIEQKSDQGEDEPAAEPPIPSATSLLRRIYTDWWRGRR